MKMFGNACYAMGIVVAIGFALSMCAKPVEEVLGAMPKCTSGQPNEPLCSAVTYSGVINGIPWTWGQPDCPGEYTSATSGNTMAVDYQWDVCTDDGADVCAFSVTYFNFTHCCVPE